MTKYSEIFIFLTLKNLDFKSLSETLLIDVILESRSKLLDKLFIIYIHEKYIIICHWWYCVIKNQNISLQLGISLCSKALGNMEKYERIMKKYAHEGKMKKKL